MIQTYKTTLVSKIDLAPEIALLKFQIPQGQTLDFKAGQYMILFVPQEGKHDARRLYSIVSAETKHDSFDLLIKYEPFGIGSEFLKKMNVGDQPLFQGPAGVFTLRNTDKNIVFLATGTGIAPMIPMLHKLVEMKLDKSVYLFWGLPTYKDVYFLKELREMQQKLPSFQFQICISREKDGSLAPEDLKMCLTLGRITVGLDQLLTDKKDGADFYICGGKEMVESMRQFLAQNNISKENIYFEKFV